MPRASTAQTVLPLGDQPEESREWDQILRAAFADPDRASGFLSQAEEAVRAQPGDGLILLLAATAALLDQNPKRAQVFLKRFSRQENAGLGSRNAGRAARFVWAAADRHRYPVQRRARSHAARDRHAKPAGK